MCAKNRHLSCDMQQEKIDVTAICNIPLYFQTRSASKPKNFGEQYATEDSENNIQVKTKIKQLKAEVIANKTLTC